MFLCEFCVKSMYGNIDNISYNILISLLLNRIINILVRIYAHAHTFTRKSLEMVIQQSSRPNFFSSSKTIWMNDGDMSLINVIFNISQKMSNLV